MECFIKNIKIALLIAPFLIHTVHTANGTRKLKLYNEEMCKPFDLSSDVSETPGAKVDLFFYHLSDADTVQEGLKSKGLELGKPLMPEGACHTFNLNTLLRFTLVTFTKHGDSNTAEFDMYPSQIRSTENSTIAKFYLRPHSAEEKAKILMRYCEDEDKIFDFMDPKQPKGYTFSTFTDRHGEKRVGITNLQTNDQETVDLFPLNTIFFLGYAAKGQKMVSSISGFTHNK